MPAHHGDGSRHTLTSYRHDLIGFARWFAAHVPTEPGFAPDAVTPTDVRGFRSLRPVARP